MPMVPSTTCRRCRQRRLRGDGAGPCLECRANGVRGPAGHRATPIRTRPFRGEAAPVAAAPDAIPTSTTEDDAGDDNSGGRGILTRFSSEPVPDEMRTGGGGSSGSSHSSDSPSDIAFDPIPSQYREAQIIFDGIDYCESLSNTTASSLYVSL